MPFFFAFFLFLCVLLKQRPLLMPQQMLIQDMVVTMGTVHGVDMVTHMLADMVTMHLGAI